MTDLARSLRVVAYITVKFVQLKADSSPTPAWLCATHPLGLRLGIVQWDVQTRRFIYAPTCGSSYAPEMLLDIVDFITRVDRVIRPGLLILAGGPPPP